MTFTPTQQAELHKLSCDLHAASCKPCKGLREELVEFLTQIEEYMDDRLDVDEPEPGRQVMNAEGHFYMAARKFLRAMQEQGE